MQNINEIRRHIRAIEQTRKITNAMHLVSSSRMKKVISQVEYNRVYSERVHLAMRHILASSEGISHPYLQGREGDDNTYIVISADKGLVGSYNSDILKFAYEHVCACQKKHLITVGITATQYFTRRGIIPDIKIIGASQDPSLFHARHMVQDVFRIYDEGLTDRIYVIYTAFASSSKWYPEIQQLLPIVTDEEKILKNERMIYHPSPQQVFGLLVPQYTMGLLYGALLQAYASEHCARMNAMHSATQNADELLKKLKVSYNMARQSAITQEITEIGGAALAQSALEDIYD